MGLFGSIGGFFGGDEIGNAIAAGQEYVMGPWNQAWSDLFGEGGMQEQTLGDYQAQYQELIDFFDTGAKEAQRDLQIKHAEEMGYVGQGEQNALQQTRQAFGQLRGETLASNIMGGLANTSFGSGMMSNVTRQEGQALGDVQTQYAMQKAQTIARQGMEQAAMSEWRIGGGTANRGQFAEGLAGLRGSWASRRLGAEEFGAQLRGGWADRNIAHTERNVGVGMGFAGNLLGGLGF